MSLSGVIPPLVTPLTEEEELDEDALRWHVNYLIKKGVHGVFCLGSTGEFPYLSEEERSRVAEVVVDEAGGRVPVIVGVSHHSCRVAAKLARRAERIGADALIAIIPSYFPVTDDMAYEYYVRLAEATSLPLLIYNFPAVTNFDIKPETVAKLAEVENIVGIKDTVTDPQHTMRVLELVPEDFAVFPGSELTMQASMEAGAKGMIFGTSNIDPKPAIRIYEAYKSGDLEKARTLLPDATKLLPLLTLAPTEYLPAIIKNAMKLTGKPINPTVRKPLPNLSSQQIEKLKETLKKLSLLKEGE